MKPGRVVSKRRAGTSTSVYSSMEVGGCKMAVGTCVQLDDDSLIFITTVTEDSTSGFTMVLASTLQLPLNALHHDAREHAYMLTKRAVIGSGACSGLSIVRGLTVVPAWLWSVDLSEVPGLIMLAGSISDSSEHEYHPLDCSSAHIWAALKFVGTPTFQYETIKSNLQIRIHNWLAMRGQSTSAGKIAALSFENIPPDFLFWMLGKDWCSSHRAQHHYKESSRLHEVRGSTSDFVHVFGRDLGVPDQNKYEEGSMAMYVYSSVPHLEPVIWRYSLRRVGILLLIFVDIGKLGPTRDVDPQPGQAPNPKRPRQWGTDRNDNQHATVARLLPSQYV